MSVGDYPRGALEALQYALKLLDDHARICERCRKACPVVRPLREAREDLLRGIIVDFRERIKPSTL